MLLTDSTTISTQGSIQILKIDNQFAQAEIALFGGHLLSFKPKHDNRERLWVSQNAVLDGKKAIRGGIPICWPWFGDHKEPQYSAHGYVRNQKWTIVNSQEIDAGTQIILKPNTCMGEGFSGNVELQLIVVVGKTLSIQLITKNVGDTEISYNCALHSYFSVSDIKLIELLGLEGKYLDKTRAFDSFDTPIPYQFSEETDRVHLHKAPEVSIVDGQNITKVQSKGHDSMIVWNPWQDKSISMGDMADDSYLTMVCIETAVTQGQKIAAGQTHMLEQVIV